MKIILRLHILIGLIIFLITSFKLMAYAQTTLEIPIKPQNTHGVAQIGVEYKGINAPFNSASYQSDYQIQNRPYLHPFRQFRNGIFFAPFEVTLNFDVNAFRGENVLQEISLTALRYIMEFGKTRFTVNALGIHYDTIGADEMNSLFGQIDIIGIRVDQYMPISYSGKYFARLSVMGTWGMGLDPNKQRMSDQEIELFAKYYAGCDSSTSNCAFYGFRDLDHYNPSYLKVKAEIAFSFSPVDVKFYYIYKNFNRDYAMDSVGITPRVKWTEHRFGAEICYHVLKSTSADDAARFGDLQLFVAYEIFDYRKRVSDEHGFENYTGVYHGDIANPAYIKFINDGGNPNSADAPPQIVATYGAPLSGMTPVNQITQAMKAQEIKFGVRYILPEWPRR